MSGEPEVGEGHARGPERVGLHDVGASLEIGGVDSPDGIPLRQHEDVDAVFQVLGMVAKSLTPKSLFVEGKGVDHRSHGAVENGDAVGQQGMKSFDTSGARCSGHVGCLGDTSVRGLATFRPWTPLKP